MDVLTYTCPFLKYSKIPSIETGGSIANKTVPAAVLKSGTIPNMRRDGIIIPEPVWPIALPKNPAQRPIIIV